MCICTASQSTEIHQAFRSVSCVMKKIKGQKDLVNYSAKIALEFGNVARAILYSQIIYRRDIKQRSEFYKTDKERSLEL